MGTLQKTDYLDNRFLFFYLTGDNGSRSPSDQTEGDAFLTAATHQHIYPTLRQEDLKQEKEDDDEHQSIPSLPVNITSKVQLTSAGKTSTQSGTIGGCSSSLSGSVRTSQSGDDFITARSSSPQLTQLLTTPPRSTDVGHPNGDALYDMLGKPAGSSSSRPTSMSFQTKRRSSTRQKSPLATSSSKAPQLLHASSRNEKAAPTRKTTNDPLPSAPPMNVLHSERLGKRDAQSLPGKSPHSKRFRIMMPKESLGGSLKGQTHSASGVPKQHTPQKFKATPPSSLPRPTRMSSPGKALSNVFARATGTVIGKLLQARRPSL